MVKVPFFVCGETMRSVENTYMNSRIKLGGRSIRCICLILPRPDRNAQAASRSYQVNGETPYHQPMLLYIPNLAAEGRLANPEIVDKFSPTMVWVLLQSLAWRSPNREAMLLNM